MFSQVAFGHYDDVVAAFERLTETVRPETVLIAEIDLNTHTRWIWDVDPLNIYLYSDFVYNFFRFAGTPNKVRPKEYTQILEKLGWKDAQIKPLVGVDKHYIDTVIPRLSARFRFSSAEIEYLSVMVCAKLG